MKIKNLATIYAIVAAALYAINVPFSKILLNYIHPTMLAAFLYLGAAKTSAYYSIAPFLGVAFGMIILRERPAVQFYIALIVMILSTYFIIKDSIELQHSHEHSHGDLIHTHKHTHIHTHNHIHFDNINNHEHKHKEMLHIHSH